MSKDTNKIIFLRYICNALEILCCVVHPFYKFEILLTGQYCNLAIISANMDEKYKLNAWERPVKIKRYYEDYPG